MRRLASTLLAAACLLVPMLGQAAPEAYPAKPIKVIVPYTPGSGPDVVARTLGTAIQRRLGQPFVVDNRAGANGTIGIDAIAKAPVDGYTLGLVVNSFSMNPSLYKNVADPVKGFEPVAMVARGSMVLVTRPSLGAKDLKSLLALARAKPSGLSYATPGNGSPQHLATALLGQAGNVQLLHVPYRGSGPAVTAALSGEVDLMFMPVHTAAPFIKDGKLVPLLVSTQQRSGRLPEVPTAEEFGLKGFDVDLWYAVIAPAKTAPEAVKRMRQEVEVALKDPTVAAGFESQGLEPVFLPPDEFTKLLQADVARWAAVIQRAKIVAE